MTPAPRDYAQRSTADPATTRHDTPALRITRHCAYGGVVSPLLANVYLHRLDRAWRGAYGTPVRYADLCCAQHKSAYVGHRIMPRLSAFVLVGAAARCSGTA